MLLGAAACKPPDLRPFLGAWRASGSISVTLGTEPAADTFSRSSSTPYPGYQIAFRRQSDSELVSTDSLGCTLIWEVTRRGATTEPGQSCTASTRHSGAQTLEIGSGGVTLKPIDGDHLAAAGNLLGTVSQGGALLGTVKPAAATLSGQLLRIAPTP